MVNAQAVNGPVVNQLEDQAVRVVKNLFVFNPDADQPGYLKEASPRKLLRRFAP